MFKVKNALIIAKNSNRYLSFPDIIQNPKNQNNLFLIYREGNKHHPTWSKLILMESRSRGEKWRRKKTFPLTLKKDGGVWNCPRLSYIDTQLVIMCDVKSSMFERTASWTTYMIRKNSLRFIKQLTPIPGMVPDRIIKFKDKLLCANHKIKSPKNDLIQLISWSRDNGKTWYDTNIVANHLEKQFCEASVVNMGCYLIAYLRDNSGHMRNIWYVLSEDGINWRKPIKLPIFGQRVTAIRDENEIVGTYRDSQNIAVGMFRHDLSKKKIKKVDIDWEYKTNQYHFGYTGLIKIGPNSYIVVNYTKQDEINPYIKLMFVDSYSP